ncbi:MAG: DUF4129 domain-containing protein [Bacteroidota bacterium]
MRFGINHILLISLLSVLCCSTLAAQDGVWLYEEQNIERRAFDQKDWENFSESLDYSGAAPKPKKARERSTPEVRDTPDPPSFDGFPDMSPLFKGLLFILVIGVLGWVIYTFVRTNEIAFAPVTEGEEGEEDLTNIIRLEEELDKRNVDPYLLKAEQEKNYHLAVRLHFLALLKQMNEQRLIHWKKDRTNRAYLNQLRGQDYYSTFRELTLTFERVWYGNYHPPVDEYKTIRSQFEAYRASLQNVVAV